MINFVKVLYIKAIMNCNNNNIIISTITTLQNKVLCKSHHGYALINVIYIVGV